MKIRFGTELDDVQPTTDVVRMNVLTCVVLGLLQQFELGHGIANPTISRLKRIVCYERGLIEAAKQPRFYTRSLEKDSFAVAGTLLDWRDEMKLAGWVGDSGAQDLTRIHDLAAASSSAAANVCRGWGTCCLRSLANSTGVVAGG